MLILIVGLKCTLGTPHCPLVSHSEHADMTDRQMIGC